MAALQQQQHQQLALSPAEGATESEKAEFQLESEFAV